jgi:hypothetical protein
MFAAGLSNPSSAQAWLDAHSQWLPLIVPLYVVVIWLLVAFAISHIGGWAALAARFRFSGDFQGLKLKRQSGQMRFWTNYNNVLTLGANAEGFYLATMFLFRFQHPALLIPWQEVMVSPPRKCLFRTVVRLTLDREKQIPLVITAKVAEKVKAAAGKHWPVEALV